RDAETAEIAIQSALTGHLVFSTLHTNDAAGAVSRLLEMGVEDYLLSSCLLAIIAQRLVRVLCPACKKKMQADRAMLSDLGVSGDLNDTWVYEPAGCEKCAHTGYRGRTGIYEFLRVTENVRKLILNHSDSSTIKQAAVQEGMRTLRMDGSLRVLEGATSFSELLRVTLEE
ncbi:MAG: GspE/PulE family protein, partial [Candidatus Odinarchaeota archaeon]